MQIVRTIVWVLLLVALLEDGNPQIVRQARALAARYLAFLTYAFDPSSGRFRNFMSYSRSWLDDVGSEDCQGRALWALGSVARATTDPGQRSQASTPAAAATPAIWDIVWRSR